ncbi:YibE/F family protein [Fodinicola feengrottensis]|uniref:YibE/F family protein n=1 Tax=Fodinicola feengrottensis TaxID=435914 RepID=A0ABN2JCU5_9ACTN
MLLATLLPMGLATLIGLLFLYPYGGTHVGVPPQYQPFVTGQAQIVDGTVTSITTQACPDSGTANQGGAAGQCQRAAVSVTSGPDTGKQVTIDVGGVTGTPLLATGERITLARTTADGVVYSFNDVARGPALIVFALLFAAVVIAVARWKGLAALVGIAVAVAIVLLFLIPALLAGRSPVLVGLVASSAILFAVLYLAHGRTAQTSTALLGTLLGLGISAALSAIAVAATHISGLSGEDAAALQVATKSVPVSGLLLCGFLIGALGVLNDVTVTQASAVWTMAETDPTATPRQLFALGMRIGRDHIASAVYTLVLAYAGSALPIMLLFTLSQQSLGTVLTSDQVAVELIRSLVGAIALVLSVPITTAVAAAVVRSTSALRRPGAHRG